MKFTIEVHLSAVDPIPEDGRFVYVWTTDRYLSWMPIRTQSGSASSEYPYWCELPDLTGYIGNMSPAEQQAEASGTLAQDEAGKEANSAHGGKVGVD